MPVEKLVAHYADGRIVKGVTYKLGEKLPGFYLVPHQAGKTDQEIYIRFSGLKAVFLVRDFEGGQKVREVEKEFIPEGHEVVVHFKDGEVLKGYALGEYSPDSERFHVIPRNRLNNNISILVERRSVERVELGKVFKAKELKVLYDTPMKRILLCFYWDNRGKTFTFPEIARITERTEPIIRRDSEIFFQYGLMQKSGTAPNEKVTLLQPEDEETAKQLEKRVQEVRKYLPRK